MQTKLHTKSKSVRRILIETADRAIQDWYRSNYKNAPCEVCKKVPFDVMHHYYPKSQSSFLRFDFRNLIFLCRGCHTKHHLAGNPTIHNIINEKRGEMWRKELESEFFRHQGHKLSDEYLLEQLEKYST